MQHLSQKLERLNLILDCLITITYEEIEMIKSARHASIYAKQDEKKRVVKEFEFHKEALNQMLLEITQAHPDTSMEEILDNAIQTQLTLFRQKLVQLHQVNKIYGTFVATLSEFFSSLVAAILPMKEEGYTKAAPKPAAFLQVSV